MSHEPHQSRIHTHNHNRYSVEWAMIDTAEQRLHAVPFFAVKCAEWYENSVLTESNPTDAVRASPHPTRATFHG